VKKLIVSFVTLTFAASFSYAKTKDKKTEKKIAVTTFFVKGMTCTGCEELVNYALNSSKDVISATSSYKTGIAEAEFDKSKVKQGQLSKVVEEKIGYKVKSYKIVN